MSLALSALFEKCKTPFKFPDPVADKKLGQLNVEFEFRSQSAFKS